jgi:hypothetical protein
MARSVRGPAGANTRCVDIDLNRPMQAIIYVVGVSDGRIDLAASEKVPFRGPAAIPKDSIGQVAWMPGSAIEGRRFQEFTCAREGYLGRRVP